MAFGKEAGGAGEGFGGGAVVEGGEDEDKAAAGEAGAEVGGGFGEVGDGGGGAEGVEHLLAGGEMGGTVAGADEAVDAVAEGEEAEAVALAVGGEGEVEGGGEAPIEDGLAFLAAGLEAAAIDEAEDFLGAFELVGAGDGAPRRAVAFQWTSWKLSPGEYSRSFSNSRPRPTWRMWREPERARARVFISWEPRTRG